MGQYYKAFNFDKKESLCAQDFGGGLKLLESCYVGTHFTNALLELLADRWRGDEVAYVGDYAYEDASREERAWLRERCEHDPWDDEAGFKDASFLWSVRTDEASGLFRTIAAELGIPEAERATEAAARSTVERTLSLSVHAVAVGVHPAADVLSSHGLGACSKYSDGRFKAELFRLPKPAGRYLANVDRGVFVDRAREPVSDLWDGRACRYDALLPFLALGNGLGGGDWPARAPGSGEVGAWAGEEVFAAAEPPDGLREASSPFDLEGAFLTATDEEIARAAALLPEKERGDVRAVAAVVARGR